MNAESGNEKGSIENLCGSIKQTAFTPIPKGDNLKEIQDEVRRRCLEYRMYHKIKDRPKAILEMSLEDRRCLHPLPAKRFEAYEEVKANVGSDLTFRYDTVKYSLPIEYVGKTVTLRVFPYEIEAWYKGDLAYRHTRPFAKDENRYIPEHYLSLLEMRPRAMRNAAPLKLGVMPPELERFRNKCTAKDKFEQLANILLLARDTDSKLVLEAVDRANKTGVPTLHKVKLFLDLEKTSDKSPLVDQVIVTQRDLDQYDILLGMEDTNDE